MTGNELAKFLYDNKVFDAYQYVINTKETIKIALFCKEKIVSLISKMEITNTEWQNDLFKKLSNQASKIKSISITASSMPSYNLEEVCGTGINIPFLLDKLIKDFFQYIRNSFDCMSQIVNASCLASHSESIDFVDFDHMEKTFTKKYSQMFPTISSWFDKICKSNEFSYIRRFTNRIKHICDIGLRLPVTIIGDSNKPTINPFIKNKTQYPQQNISECLTSIYDFTSRSYSELLLALKTEIPRKKFVENRFHRVNVYQQLFKSEAKDNYSIVYIDATTNIENMPNEIEVLLACEIDGKIKAENCPANIIYIKDPKTNQYYLEKYVVCDNYENCDNDILLKYRKYKKHTLKKSTHLFFQPTPENENKGVLYRANPFMDITTTIDD